MRSDSPTTRPGAVNDKAIDYELVMPMRVREVIRLLEKHGWLEMRSKGSHRHFKHPTEAAVITVPGNEGKELAPGTLHDIPKKAGLK